MEDYKGAANIFDKIIEKYPFNNIFLPLTFLNTIIFKKEGGVNMYRVRKRDGKIVKFLSILSISFKELIANPKLFSNTKLANADSFQIKTGIPDAIYKENL